MEGSFGPQEGKKRGGGHDNKNEEEMREEEGEEEEEKEEDSNSDEDEDESDEDEESNCCERHYTNPLDAPLGRCLYQFVCLSPFWFVSLRF